MKTKLFLCCLFVIATIGGNAFAATITIDVDSDIIGVSSYFQDGFLFETDGTFNILDGRPDNTDNIGANGSTSLRGFTMRRLDGEAFNLFSVKYRGTASIGGVALPSADTFETFSFLPGTAGVNNVTLVPIDLATGTTLIWLAGFTTAATGPTPPAVPLPAGIWLLLSSLLVMIPKHYRSKNVS